MADLILVGRVVSVVSGAGLLGLAVRSVRSRENPAATSFAGLLGILGLAALCGGATAHAGTAYKLVWLVTTLAIPMALALFAVDYYGLTYLDTRARVLAAVTPAILGIVGGALVILGTPRSNPGATAPVEALTALPAPVFDVAGTLQQLGIYYTTSVILLAVALVLRTVVRYDHLDTRLGPVIAFVGVWPWFAYIMMPELIGVVGVDVLLLGVASGYTGSVLAAALAVGPLGLFVSTPAAGNVGPETVLDSMDDAVIVVDDDDHVLRLNAVACDVFDVTESAAVGGSLANVLGTVLDALPASGVVALETGRGSRPFEMTRSTITSRTGAAQGEALVLREVTRRRTREQRLEVLNRVLRHNLRNNASSILGRAELISDGGDRAQAERIVDTTNDLVDVAERAREIEEMMTVPAGDATADLGAVVDRIVADVTAEYDVEVTTALPNDAAVAVSPDVLESTLRNLVENAAQHNDADEPIVVVSADRREDDTLAISVADNGPGIPDHERAVLEQGEDQLSHGSGLGLWAVNWGVTRMGGHLSFDGNDPRGTVVTIVVPAEAVEAVQAK